MKAIWLTSILFWALLPNLALCSESNNALWDTVAELKFPLGTRAPFRETRSSTLLRKPAQQTGELWLASSGDFVMQILTPRHEERRLSEQRLSLTRSRTDKNGATHSKQRSIKLDRTKGAHHLLLSIVDVLEGNVARLRQRFDISSVMVSGKTNPAAWSIALTPKNPVLRRDMQQLLIEGEGEKLQSLRATRGNNSWQQIELLEQPITGPASTTDNGD